MRILRTFFFSIADAAMTSDIRAERLTRRTYTQLQRINDACK